MLKEIILILHKTPRSLMINSTGWTESDNRYKISESVLILPNSQRSYWQWSPQAIRDTAYCIYLCTWYNVDSTQLLCWKSEKAKTEVAPNKHRNAGNTIIPLNTNVQQKLPAGTNSDLPNKLLSVIFANFTALNEFRKLQPTTTHSRSGSVNLWKLSVLEGGAGRGRE